MNKRGFKTFVGKTIKSVDSSCINVVRFKFTDGTEAVIDCDEQHCGIGIISVQPNPIKEK